MAKATNLQVVGAKDAPAEAPLTGARAHLAAAIAQRPALMAQAETISVAQARLAALTTAEARAAETVTALEAELAESMEAWAFANEQAAPPAIADGADLVAARELLGKARLAASAARMAEPALAAQMEAVQTRRAALEDRIKAHALDVLGDEANAIAEEIASLERRIAAECAKLAALRRPAMRLAPDPMAGKKIVHTLNMAIRERSYSEAEALALERRFQALADALVGGDAGATLIAF
jgi:hypothetical protein